MKKLLLIGARGSGKSTLGPVVADALGMPFVDLDALVLKRFSEPTVRQVWAVCGEQAWRAAEHEALNEALQEQSGVIGLGGGTPMIPAARSLIDAQRAAGTARCLYLQCDAGELARRLSQPGDDRPSLTGRDPAEEIAAVLAEREATYTALADATVEVTQLTLDEAGQAAVEAARRLLAAQGPGGERP